MTKWVLVVIWIVVCKENHHKNHDMATLSYLAEFCHLSKQKLVTVEANVLKYLTLYEET